VPVGLTSGKMGRAGDLPMLGALRVETEIGKKILRNQRPTMESKPARSPDPAAATTKI
jgi:hypothetical protein